MVCREREKDHTLGFQSCETVEIENQQVAMFYAGTLSPSIRPLAHLILWLILFLLKLDYGYLILYWILACCK